jgi:uncharacterized membrane protein (DUF4010 family)
MGDKWGLRTYSLISLLGAVAGMLYLFDDTNLSIIITVSFFILIFIYYGVGGWMIKSMGLTTELGGIFSYLIGFFVTSGIFPLQLVIAITVVIELILSVKEKSHHLILGIKRSEIDAFIGFAIIALVILPFLPNQSFHLTDIPAMHNILKAYDADLNFFQQLELINPFRLWFIVAIITGINILGHVLEMIIGKEKGVIIASAVGGFISSTSTTQSLAYQSRNSTQTNKLVTAAILANLTSFFQVFVLVASLNTAWLVYITPTLGIIILASLLSGSYFYLKDRNKMKVVVSEIHSEADITIEKERKSKIFSLKPALKFAILLILVRAFTKAALLLFGQSGFLVTSVMASLTGIDAVVINLAELAKNVISPQSALLTLVAVNATNLISKSIYSFTTAKKEFSIKFLVSVVFIIVASFLGYYFLA